MEIGSGGLNISKKGKQERENRGSEARPTTSSEEGTAAHNPKPANDDAVTRLAELERIEKAMRDRMILEKTI